MASATQIQAPILNLRYRIKKTSVYQLKRPWSYGRGYAVIVGVALVVLAGLAVVYLHQTWKIWQARSSHINP